ncbi:MAG TPA: phosphotransferase [Acidimicrobiales bacterium]
MTAGDPGPVDDRDDLTPAWLTAALRAGGHEVTVTAADAEPIGHGQIGANYRLALELNGGGGGAMPSRLVAKLGAGADRSIVSGGYRKEVAFYLDIAATVAVRTPRCWYGAISADGTVFTLLLEDLAPAETGDQLAGCGPAAAEAAVANLAGLHGPRWDDATLWSHPELDPVDEDGAALLGEIYASAVTTFVGRYEAELDSGQVTLLHHVAEAITPWIARVDRFAVGHGDYRLDNLLFGPDGAVSAVDWQTLSVVPPGRDLAYFCGNSLEPEVRRTCEDRLVTTWRDGLATHGVQLDEADAIAEYRLGVLQGPLITVLGAVYATAERSEQADAMFLTMLRRGLVAVDDLDPFSLL